MASDEEKRRKREEKEAKAAQDRKDWEAIQKRQEKINNDRRQKALDAAAEKEAMERLEDDFLDRQFLELFDIDAKAAKDYLETAMQADKTDEEALQAYEALKEAQKAKQGGIIFGPNPEKAKKIIKKNRAAIKNTIAKGKKKKGCLGALAVMAGVGVASLYGMYEGVSAIASALF